MTHLKTYAQLMATCTYNQTTGKASLELYNKYYKQDSPIKKLSNGKK